MNNDMKELSDIMHKTNRIAANSCGSALLRWLYLEHRNDPGAPEAQEEYNSMVDLLRTQVGVTLPFIDRESKNGQT